jgi:hypothetical protein
MEVKRGGGESLNMAANAMVVSSPSSRNQRMDTHLKKLIYQQQQQPLQLVSWIQQLLKAYNCAGFDDASLNCSSWISNSGHFTILKRAWSANFKMVWYVLIQLEQLKEASSKPAQL